MRFTTRLILGTFVGALATIAVLVLMATALEASVGLASPVATATFLLCAWVGAVATLYAALAWARTAPSAERAAYAAPGRMKVHAMAAGAVALPHR